MIFPLISRTQCLAVSLCSWVLETRVFFTKMRYSLNFGNFYLLLHLFLSFALFKQSARNNFRSKYIDSNKQTAPSKKKKNYNLSFTVRFWSDWLLKFSDFKQGCDPRWVIRWLNRTNNTYIFKFIVLVQQLHFNIRYLII